MKQRLRSMPHKKVGSNLLHTCVDISFMYKIATMLPFDLCTYQLNKHESHFVVKNYDLVPLCA